jgi:pyruvate,water dikinase
LITEAGGILALTFSMAREYGIPAVTGVKGLIQSVENGDMIDVNGATGEVRLLRNMIAGRY